MKLKDVRKALVAVAVVALTAIHAALNDGTLSLPIASPWMPVVITAIGAVLVWLVRNGDKPEQK